MIFFQIIGWLFIVVFVAIFAFCAIGPAVMDWRDGRW